MKQGTLKTLGAAALGAAFAATAAGTASAAPVNTNGVVHKLPVDKTGKLVTKSVKTPATGEVKTPINPQGNSLGGLPTGALGLL